MRRFVGSLVALLLACPALWAQDEPKKKELTPAEQYQAVLQDYQKAMQAFALASRNAKSLADQKAFRDLYPQKDKYAPKLIELAEKHPKDPVAIDALIWIVRDNFGGQPGKGHQAKAIALLVRDHVQSEKLAVICRSLSNSFDTQSQTLLRALLEKSPHKAVQAEACLALSQSLSQRARLVQQMVANPAMAQQYEAYVGKEEAAALSKADLSAIEAESAKHFKEFAEKHLGDMKAERLTALCQNFMYGGGAGSEVLLRTLIDKDARPEVQGMATLALAKVLNQRAERSKGDEAAKIRAESEKLLEQAQDKFGTVKMPYRGTVGSKAKAELFDLRHLSVGKVAPDVEGEDQDGKKFKLSDYRGKVVFLDFWSQY